MIIKTIILAGGLGTRISEETLDKPKPMVLLDEKPILWHVMSIYAQQGFNDFVIASGYLSQIIEDWIREARLPWNVTCLDTGLTTQTAGRIKRVVSQFAPQPWFVTYGDGLGNINLLNLLDNHRRNKGFVTVTAVRPPARFGSLSITNGLVRAFGEKSQSDSGWINGGFIVCDSQLLSYYSGDNESLEFDILPRVVQSDNLMAFLHNGFWQPMDTLRDKNYLEDLWASGNAPWKVW